ncbi:CPBP family intramembrane glutamic endopeptidase [Stratiformator vulcanicus]|uniref:CAAX amino terminal protease self-immunity n=1 Tax=Stratiformator vulcanicus TaxID=2527980 RepID=A0A517R6T9_9PLAN|nr:CPBP family intramembrane glutamic endopeptidase [Stratiformator vulcanicus]QDT39575.1 CAAX amino terminal protease self- immunity [Stratiformator vulcanicus]
MKTAIGSCLRSRPRNRAIAVSLALTVTVLDFLIVGFPGAYDEEKRLVLALVGCAAIVGLADGDAQSLGLRFTPRQGWLWWTKSVFGLALVIAIALGLYAGVLILFGQTLPIRRCPPAFFTSYFWQMCVLAPTMEEAIYRFILCVPLAAAIGGWKTIFTSGAVFAVLHVVYGNPSPENIFGGFLIAWAFVISESILIPFLLHAGGNFIVLLSNVAAWHFLPPSI